MEKKREAPDITSHSRLFRWLDNFWYHYKWPTIIVAFFLIVCIVGFAQCSSQEQSDMTLTVAVGNPDLSGEPLEVFTGIMADLLPEDLDGNGAKVLSLAQFSIFTEDELVELYTYTDPETGEERVQNDGLAGARHYNTERIQSLQTYIMTGECAVWLVSPYVYETMFQDRVQVIETAVLGETALYQYYDALREQLPPDTMVVLMQPIMGYMSEQENYRNAVDYYHAIVEFSAP